MADEAADLSDIDFATRAVPKSLRWALGLSGVTALVAGGVAVYVSRNGSGTAALIAAGVVLILVALLAERLESLEAAGMKLGLRGAQAAVAATEKEEAAVIAESRGDHERAARLRAEAAELRKVALTTARAYEGLRSTMGSGWARTQQIERLLDEAMRAAPDHVEAPMVRKLFEEGSDGTRIFALKLMQRDPKTADVRALADAISEPRSAMEQWHALAAAEQAVRRGLAQADLAELRAIITSALSDGRIRKEDSDRYAVAHRIVDLMPTLPN
jgi:hypothetical protein